MKFGGDELHMSKGVPTKPQLNWSFKKKRYRLAKMDQNLAKQLAQSSSRPARLSGDFSHLKILKNSQTWWEGFLHLKGRSYKS